MSSFFTLAKLDKMDVNVIFIDKWWSVHCCSFWKEITYALFDCIKLEARVTFASSLALAKFWKSFSRLHKRKLEMMLQGQKVKGKIGSNQDALEPLLPACLPLRDPWGIRFYLNWLFLAQSFHDYAKVLRPWIFVFWFAWFNHIYFLLDSAL